MDQNYLDHQRGISFGVAASAGCDRSRTIHEGLAAGYGLRISALRDAFAVQE